MNRDMNSTLELPLPQLSRVDYRDCSYLTDESLFSCNGLTIAFSLRHGGVSKPPYESLNLASHVGDESEAVARNRHLFLEALGIEAYEPALLNPLQVHGDVICIVDERFEDDVYRQAREGADGVVCLAACVPVLLCFADCVPVILASPTGAFAVVHAGWRGALAGIVGKAVASLCSQSGCAPETINCYIGPHIGASCYEVSHDVLSKFVAEYGTACDAGKGRLSLTDALVTDLTRTGVARERIGDSGICTMTNREDFYSYRGEGGTCGRHGALACLRAHSGR